MKRFLRYSLPALLCLILALSALAASAGSYGYVNYDYLTHGQIPYGRDDFGTFANIEETGEFVINMISADMVDTVIPTSSHVPFEVDEYELANLEATESNAVSAPGIKGAYCQMECKLTKVYHDKDPIGIPYLLIIGEVVHLEVDEDCLDKEYGVLDLEKVKPLMMLESDKGMHFCTIEDLDKFETFGAMFPDGKDPLEWMYQDDD